MIVELIANGVCAFAGAVAFAVLFSVPRHFYIGCGITGAAGWCVYLILEEYAGLSAAIASFCGTLVVVLLSRMLTVRMKCPITIFLVSGVIPMVPGAGIYYTTYYLVMNQLGIVLGIAIVLSIPRDVFQKGYWKQLKYHRKKKNILN